MLNTYIKEGNAFIHLISCCDLTSLACLHMYALSNAHGQVHIHMHTYVHRHTQRALLAISECISEIP